MIQNKYFKKLTFLFIFIFTLGLEVYSQIENRNPPPPPPPGNFDYTSTHILSEVTFHQNPSSPGSWIKIRKDDNTGNISGDTETIAWTIGANKPIAYLSGSKARVEADFTTNCVQPVVWIRGDGPEGYDLAPIGIPNVGGNLNYIQDIEKTFTYDQVRYWGNFEIKWYIREVIDGPEELIATSFNPLYVTHKKAITASGLIPFYTVLHLGCANGNNETLSTNIVNKIFMDFSKREVSKVGSSELLTYYDPDDPAPYPDCFTTKDLLNYGDGRCGAWANFLNDIYSMQGISSTQSTVLWKSGILPLEDKTTLDAKIASFFEEEAINVTVIGGSGVPYGSTFFVKNWSSHSDNTFSISDWVGYESSTVLLDNGNTITNKNITGLPGQGNTNPTSSFPNHAVVKYLDNYYDPSYGSTAINDRVWENAALDSFGAMLMFKKTISGEIKFYLINWFGHENSITTTSDVSITP